MTLPVRRSSQHKSLLTVVSATSAPPFQPPAISETFAAKAETLYATNTSLRKQEAFLYEYNFYCVFLPTKTHNRTSLFGNTLFEHSRHFDY
jgi:hypothetical protein